MNCPECTEKNLRIRELEALLEATRLEADEAVESLRQVCTALVEQGLDEVVEQLGDMGIEFPD